MGKRERELFLYEGGVLYWKSPTSNRVKVGSEAGSTTTNGYRVVRYDNKVRMLHRVIWDYHYDKSCEGYLIDHKDNNGLNNRIENLRLCDYSQNAANSFNHSDGAVKSKGVTAHGSRFRAQISKMGRRYHIGLFDTEEEASVAYKDKARQLYGEYHR